MATKKSVSSKAVSPEAKKPEIKVTPGELPSSARTKLAQQAVNTRWALAKALPEELQKRFIELPIDEALQELARMRQMCDVAAKVINQRMTEESSLTVCATCTGGKKGNQWRMIKPVRLAGTGTIQNLFFCSDVCIVLYNRDHQGVAGISDRGMSRGSAMPNEVAAASANAPKR